MHSDLSPITVLLLMSPLLLVCAPTEGHIGLTGLSAFLFLMILRFHHLPCIKMFYLDLGSISALNVCYDQSSLGR